MKHAYLVILFFCAVSTSLFADISISRRDNLIKIQQMLENELSSILHAWDSKAIVTIRVYEQSEIVPIPSAPFVMPDVSVRDSDNNPVIEHISITVLSVKTALPKSLEKVIRDTAQGYGRLNLQFRTLDEEILKDRDPGKKSEEAIRETEAEKAKLSAKAALDAENSKKLADILKMVLGLLPGLLIFFSVILLIREVRKGFAVLAKGVSSKESAAPAPSPQNSPSANIAQARALSAGRESSGEESAIAKLPLKAVTELFADAYWGEFDYYAAYIWRHLPLDTRKSLIGSFPWVSSYVASLAGKPEENLGCDQEAYYLEPLSFVNLNNTVVTDIVRKIPALLNQVSTLRAKCLTLGAIERIELTKNNASVKTKELPDFSSFTPSQPRKVSTKRLIPIRSLEEEEEVLQLQNVTTEIMELVPSLGWMMELTDSEISSLLSGFNPEDLASAWIGPKHVLDRLSNCLPEKKRNWVISFSRSIQQDRDSPTFLQLHALSIEARKRRSEVNLEAEKIAA